MILSEINEDNYFDAAQGLYWYCVDYHSGLSCELYSIQCTLGYKPSATERSPDTEKSKEVYESLESKEIDPKELHDKINEIYESIED